MESQSNSHQEDGVKPLYMYQYLQQLGDRQKEVIEKFYHAAVDRPCGDVADIKCEDSFSNMTYFGCSFLSPVQDSQARPVSEGESENGNQTCREPYNPNIVGPKSCEYCGAKTTLDCDPKSCERPKLYFIKKKPPFENSRVQWTADGYSSRDIEYLTGLK
jgi:hypothetical protein